MDRRLTPRKAGDQKRLWKMWINVTLTPIILRFVAWKDLTPYFEAKSLQLMLAACCLAPIVLNIWSHLRLPDACYPVADQPCRDGSLTRWNNRPCSDAHPFACFA